MATGQLFKTPENIERFVTMVLLGCTRIEICEEIGIKKSTFYTWLEDKDIIAELDKRRKEIKDEGLAFIKGRYKKYLENIDKICNDFTDKRSCLAANQFMVEKIDGKNTANLELSNEVREVIISDDDIDKEIEELEN